MGQCVDVMTCLLLTGLLQGQVQVHTCAAQVQVSTRYITRTSGRVEVCNHTVPVLEDPDQVSSQPLPRLPLYLVFLGVSLLFLVVNLVCALLVKTTAADVKTIVLVRVTINDSLFVLCAVSLSVCLYKVAKMSLANIYLESKVKRRS